MDILDILLDILLKPPQPLMGLFFNIPLPVICSQTVLNSRKLFQMLNLLFVCFFCFFFCFFGGGKSREINKIQSIILSLPIVLTCCPYPLSLYTTLYYCIYLLSLVCCAQFFPFCHASLFVLMFHFQIP